MRNDSFLKNGLFKQTIFGKLVKNSFWLTLAQGFNGLANFLIIIYLAKRFGPITYGRFSYAVAFVMLFATLFDMGLTTVITKKFAENVAHERDFLLLFFLKLGLGLISLLLINMIAYEMGKDFVMLKVISCLSVSQFCIQLLNLFYALFRSRQKMEHEAGIRFFYIFSLMLGLVLILRMHPTIFLVSLVYAFVSLVVVGLTIFILRYLFIWDRTRLNIALCKQYLSIGIYLALAQGVGDIMVNTDTFLLGYWNLLEKIGFYSAAIKINAMILFPMSIISTAIFPILIQALNVSQQKFQQYWKLWMQYTVLLGFLTVFLVIVYARDIILLIYTSEYLPAIRALRIVMVTAMIVYINNLYYHILVIKEQQRLILYAMIVGCVLNVVMNLFFIPKWGIEGSAIATAISQFAYGIVCMLTVIRKNAFKTLHYAMLSRLCMAVISGICAWLVIRNMTLSWPISCLCMILIYLIIHSMIITLQNRVKNRAVPASS